MTDPHDCADLIDLLREGVAEMDRYERAKWTAEAIAVIREFDAPDREEPFQSPSRMFEEEQSRQHEVWMKRGPDER